MARDQPAHKPSLARRTLRPRWLVLHAGVYLVLSASIVVIWWLSEASRGIQREFWPGWFMLILALPLGLHAAIVFAARSPEPSRRPPPATRSAEPARAPAADRQERMLATVLFTDIVGSTERVGTVGDRRWGELLDAHDRLARELVDRFGGQLVKSTGDGILAVFDRPGRGIRCATALRDQLRGMGVDIRAGLHTGEAQFRGADVGGIAVHIAARVMGTAGPGEILVSRTVRDLVAGSDYVLDDRGSHSLRGITGEWQLFAVQA